MDAMLYYVSGYGSCVLLSQWSWMLCCTVPAVMDAVLYYYCGRECCVVLYVWLCVMYCTVSVSMGAMLCFLSGYGRMCCILLAAIVDAFYYISGYGCCVVLSLWL